MEFVALLLCLMALSAESIPKTSHFLSTKYINQINNRQSTWKAGSNFHPATPLSYLKMLANDTKVMKHGHLLRMSMPVKKISMPNEGEIPVEFDARKEWGAICPTISEILDQGQCGSSWAIAPAQAFTDRYCIATKGQFKERLSTAHALNCEQSVGKGCYGGFDYMAWRYFYLEGIPTGGEFGSKQGCEPYTIPPSDDFESETGPQECQTECTNEEYTKPLNEDLKFAGDVYVLESDEDIKKDVLANGPVSVVFKVYMDFLSYKSGVYETPKGDVIDIGYHAAKLIGWGVENDTPYWLLQNTWSEKWAEGGIFKIKQGDDIFQWATAGIPKL